MDGKKLYQSESDLVATHRSRGRHAASRPELLS